MSVELTKAEQFMNWYITYHLDLAPLNKRAVEHALSKMNDSKDVEIDRLKGQVIDLIESEEIFSKKMKDYRIYRNRLLKERNDLLIENRLLKQSIETKEG